MSSIMFKRRKVVSTRMSALPERPSLTSLVAFALVVLPVAYLFSYAPVVRICDRKIEIQMERFSTGVSYEPVVGPLGGPPTVPEFRSISFIDIADASLYPAYEPVDWLIDNTSLRGPLLFWANVWGVFSEFDEGNRRRGAQAVHIP